ncbi:hypothetical protein [Thermus sediminis]|uniref:hypothetical protein n=1 Tax=Thermus sediminis TaxID=1761908 RepID=UPI001300A5A1|nr:hypothetical protein [Thermus sediminis]
MKVEVLPLGLAVSVFLRINPEGVARLRVERRMGSVLAVGEAGRTAGFVTCLELLEGLPEHR